jgi:hypothetical protein
VSEKNAADFKKVCEIVKKFLKISPETLSVYFLGAILFVRDKTVY